MKPYYQDEWVTIYNCRCEDILGELPKVDLVLTDPPYGIGESGGLKSRYRKGDGRTRGIVKHEKKEWDSKPINWGLMWELICLGKNSIVFGGNYYLVPPSQKWLVWDKNIGGDFADSELAWTNLKGAVRNFKLHPFVDLAGGKERQHPTQKPLKLMKWCIEQAGEPQTILDPFAGSCTTGRAAKDLNRKCICIECEEKYAEIGAHRMCQQVMDLS